MTKTFIADSVEEYHLDDGSGNDGNDDDSGDDLAQIHSIVRRETFESNLLGVPTTVTFSMTRFYEAILDFSWSGCGYSFNVWAWKATGINNFIRLFHKHSARDQALYGSVVVAVAHGEEGQDGSTALEAVKVTATQKGNAVLQGCKDIMTCLDKILAVYHSSIMDYALWYREIHTKPKDYSSYITRLTCHCVVHSELFSSLVPRQLIEF